MSNFWILTPTDDALSKIEGWAKIGKNRYAAFRHHLFLKQGSNQDAKNGPIYNQMEWPVETKFKMEDKIKQVISYTYNIQESITSTITSRLSQEAMSKIGSSLGISLDTLEAKIKSELETRISTELTNSLQNYLSTTKTYSVEVTKERSETLESTVPSTDATLRTRRLFVYFKLRQLFWDIYLYRTEYLQLEYKKRWLWKDIRETINQVKLDLKVPLFRIVYYEPLPSFSYCFDTYVPEVTDGDSVQCTPLKSPCPPTEIQDNNAIDQLAKLAFPVTKTEQLATKSHEYELLSRLRRDSAGWIGFGITHPVIKKRATAKKAKKLVRKKVLSKSKKGIMSKKRRKIHITRRK